MFDSLDDYQIAAVTASLDRHVLVTAPPGSGKTRVLTSRYIYLTQQGIDLSNIVAVTFTNKAAQEMKERIADALGIDQETVKKLPIATFHSLSIRWLRDNIRSVGNYKRNFTIYDEHKVQSILRRYIAENKLPMEAPVLSSAISRLQEHGIYPEDCLGRHYNYEFISIAKSYGLYPQTLAEIYRDYWKSLESANAMDFDMIILNAIRLFDKKAPIQLGIKYVLVDECQDINLAQYLLLSKLADGGALLYLTGDIDQSLYAFRGSRPELIEQFAVEYEPEQHRLVYNYRSHSAIVDVASLVIQPNYKKTNITYKPMQAVKDGGIIKWFNLNPATVSGKDESFIAKLVSGLVGFCGYDYKDIAVLCRYSRPLLYVRDILIADKIPVYVAISRYAIKTIAKDLIMFIANPSDHLSLADILSSLKYVGDKTVKKVCDFVSSTDVLPDVAYKLTEAAAQKGINKKARRSIETLANSIRMIYDRFSSNDAFTLADILEPAILNIEPVLSTDEVKPDVLSVLCELASQYPPTEEGLQEMVAFLSLISTEANPDERNAVVLSTVHSAKGLEYKVVIIFEPLRYNWRRCENEASMAEERRIFYVALTRAIERAYVVSSYSENLLESTADIFNGDLCFAKLMFEGTNVVPINLDSEFMVDLMLSGEFEPITSTTGGAV